MSTKDTLLAKVRENPDDLAARLVLADAWLEAGDTRGELAQVQHALASKKGDAKKLAEREAELIGELERTTLKSYAEKTKLRFKLGMLDEIVIDPRDGNAAKALAATLKSPFAETLRAIVLSVREDESSSGVIGKLLAKLDAIELPPSVEELRVGEIYEKNADDRVFDFFDYSLSDDLSKLLVAFPNIRRVRVDLGMAELTFAPLASKVLESFEWVTPYINADWLAPLAKSKLPALKRFVLWTGTMVGVNTIDDLDDGDEYTEGIDADAIAPIVTMLDKSSPQLRELGFVHFDGDVEALVRDLKMRGLLDRLEVLDLTGAEISAAAAKVLTSKKGLTLVGEASTTSLGEGVKLRPPAAPKGSFRYVVTQE